MGFLSLDIHESHDSRGRGKPMLTPLYQFQSPAEFCRQLPLHIASDQTSGRIPLVSERKSLTTKLSACLKL